MAISQNRKSLKDRAHDMTVRLPFMEGRNKSDMESLIGQIVTINEFGFMTDDTKDHQYAAFTVKEDPANFYFAGQVLTDILQTYEAEGYHQDINDDGLPVLFQKVKSKNGRPYTNVIQYPDEALKPAAKK